VLTSEGAEWISRKSLGCWRKNMDLRLELRRTGGLVVAFPKGDSVSVGFLSRHSRAGLWILPSLPGLVGGSVFETLPGVLKHSFPRMNAGAPTCCQFLQCGTGGRVDKPGETKTDGTDPKEAAPEHFPVTRFSLVPFTALCRLTKNTSVNVLSVTSVSSPQCLSPQCHLGFELSAVGRQRQSKRNTRAPTRHRQGTSTIFLCPSSG
jgi:hypothetical protein